jgi:predicted GIY-YIG superfamily endonuclease
MPSDEAMVMGYWVYMLRCADGSYYVGHTVDLVRRVAEHNAGQGGVYTAARLPVRLVYSEECTSRDEAATRERQIKGWGRNKKEAIVHADQRELSRLAMSATSEIRGGRPTSGGKADDPMSS